MVFTDHIFWFSKMHLIKTTNFNGCKTTKLVNQTSQTYTGRKMGNVIKRI